MRSKYVIFVAIGLFFSCQSSGKKPAGILSQDEMVRILAEVYISEEKVTALNLGTDSSRQVSDVLREKVLEEAGVPDSVFKKSFDYYMNHPVEMEKIYTILVDTLQLREQRVSHRPD